MARLLPAILIGVATAGAGVPAHAGTSFVGGGISITTSNQRALSSATIGSFGGPGCWNGIGVCNPGVWTASWMWWNNGSWYWRPPIYTGAPLVTIVRTYDPELMRAIIGPTVPEPDPAMEALREGRYADAAKLLLERAERRERAEREAHGVAIVDRSALRLFALALAGGGDMRGSAEAFARAHAEDALLGSDPILGEEVVSSGAEMRRIVLEAMEFAHRDNTGASWALVGYLMQAQGRYDESRAMMARASATPSAPIE